MQTVSRTIRPSQARRYEIKITRDLESVEADWAHLEAGGGCTAFQTRAWLKPFYDRLVPQIGLSPVFVRVMDLETKSAALLFPMTIGRYLGLKTLTFADGGVSDYGSPLWSQSFRPSSVERAALWHDFSAHSSLGSIVRLQKMPSLLNQSQSGFISAIERPSRLSFGAWGLPLPGSLHSYESSSLTASFLKDLRMRRRRLERKGAVVFAAATTATEREAAFDALVVQRNRRFVEMGRNDLLSDARYRSFYRAISVDEPNDTVRLFTVRVAGEIVAVLLALDHAGVRHVVMPTFEAGEWKNCSPGNLLIHMAIERSIQEGFAHFDFTIGDEPYKSSFGARRSELYDVLQPLTSVGAGVTTLYEWAKTARQRASGGLRLPMPLAR
ncbi:MAG: cellulose biosynthesis protein CelD [Rhizobacter sp.]|nr:cellulose biosynthesis protein CelD [Rhizobacter sp.]